ncbi:MAG: hypothetical protein V3U87_05375 [Methylococcaceae bacterium]
MIKKSSLIENLHEIIHSFRQQKFFGKVHSLETPSEGSCSFYYIELKPPYPKTNALQFLTLWSLLELYESQEDYCGKSSGQKEEIMKEKFQYIIDSWQPRPLEEKDTLRAKEIILECQSCFEKGSHNKAWMTRRRVGYYVNNKFKDSIFPSDLIEKISNKKNTGISVHDDWNVFTILIESKNVLSMFYWITYA